MLYSSIQMASNGCARRMQINIRDGAYQLKREVHSDHFQVVLLHVFHILLAHLHGPPAVHVIVGAYRWVLRLQGNAVHQVARYKQAAHPVDGMSGRMSGRGHGLYAERQTVGICKTVYLIAVFAYCHRWHPWRSASSSPANCHTLVWEHTARHV